MKCKVHKSVNKLELLSKYRLFRNALSRAIWKSKRNYEQSICQSGNVKRFFKYVSSKLKHNSSMLGNLVVNGVYFFSDLERANALNDYFATSFSKPSNHPIFQQTGPPIIFTEGNLEAALARLNSNSSPGPDKIPMFFWVNIRKTIGPHLLKLFNIFINSGFVPLEWRKALVFPLYKNTGKPYELSSYRPISLCCSLSKIFEKMLLLLIQDDIERRALISDSQHGFRKRHSTVTNLLLTYDYVLECLDRNQPVDVIYLDFRKAFDKISHELLLRKLFQLKFAPSIVNWISSFLTDRTQSVIINGLASQPVSVPSGVPQGSLIGPLLFVLYLNDLFNVRIKSKLIAYADDTKLFGAVSKDNNLSEDLAFIEQWCVQNAMELNVLKCAVLHFGHQNPKFSYQLNGLSIPIVPYYKDLGVLVDSRFSFHEHISSVSKKCFVLARIISRSFTFKSPPFLAKIFKAYVLPLIMYALPFFSSGLSRILIGLKIFSGNSQGLSFVIPHLVRTICPD